MSFQSFTSVIFEAVSYDALLNFSPLRQKHLKTFPTEDWREVLTKPITKIVVIYGSVKIKMHENKVAPTERILIHHFSTAYIQCLTIAIGF